MHFILIQFQVNHLRIRFLYCKLRLQFNLSVNMMKKVFYIILILSGLLSAQQAPFTMLQSNLISGLIPDIEEGYGVSFRDLNNDGYPDVYLVCFRNLNRLLVNNGGIIPFIDRTIYSGLGGDLSSHGNSNLELGASAADYDNDGLPDMLLAGWGKTLKLFHNLGGFHFEDVSAALHMQGLADANQGLWLDANNDGFLDLYITDEHHANRFYLNQKNGNFKETLWTTDFVDTAISEGAISADLDNDADADIYVANWNGPDYLLLNNGKGLFNRAQIDLPTLSHSTSSNSAVCGDVDNDGLSELFVAGHDGKVYLYRNHSQNGRLLFTSDSLAPFYQIGHSVYGIVLEDFNLDGWLDVFLSVRQGANRLYLNDGSGHFNPDFDSDFQNKYSTGCAAGDLDDDGDLDLFVAQKDGLSQIYLNPVNNAQFIKIRLIGVRSNREALGSKIYLSASPDSSKHLIGFREITVHTGYLSSKSPEAVFGTGPFSNLSATIVFPGGRTLMKQNLHPGNSYTIYEYGTTMRALYSIWHRIQFNITRSDFWLSILLSFLLIASLYVFVTFGFRRYRWQGPEIATQLIIWFIAALGGFVAVRGRETIFILLILNGVTITGILISALYSEQQRRLYQKRKRFRDGVQNLSAQMIHIHENKTLLREVVKTVHGHEDIEEADIYNYNTDAQNLDAVDTDNPAIPLSPEQKSQLTELESVDRTENILFTSLSANSVFNLFIPIKRGADLFSVLALSMQHMQRTINHEDIQLLLQLANQTAIAIENNNYIKESARLIEELTEAKIREQYVEALESSNKQLDQKNKELKRLFKELQQKEGQLIHSGKMASLGQLVAGISHELNNPISFIYANTKALGTYLTKLENLWSSGPLPLNDPLQISFSQIISELKEIISDNLRGSKTVKELVLNLKNFSRLDQAEWKEVRLSAGLDSSLQILKPQINESIEILKHYQDDPPIFCNPGQINQVFLNLLSNAIQALGGSGSITINLKQEKEWLVVKIADNGCGIPENILPKIFDPFFTTKDVNQGSGLGLSISYSIIQHQNGRLTVNSTPGQGSVFKIQLPLKQTEIPNNTGVQQKNV